MNLSQKDNLLAILAIDSYNQGYAKALPHDQTDIGLATLNDTPENIDLQIWEETGFYAASYDTPFGTVISYRGTDNFFETDEGIGGDGVNAYGIALGSPGGPQYNLAVEFYKSVVASKLGVSDPKVTVTGYGDGLLNTLNYLLT